MNPTPTLPLRKGTHTTLVVPGFQGSGPDHWQSWFETQVPEAQRVRDIDWEVPVLAHWATALVREIDAASGPVWIVAHSFGCLAAVVAAADRPERIGGALLVAPADPARFSPIGVRNQGVAPDVESLAPWIPASPLPFSSAVVASRNDPWLPFSEAIEWAERWGSRLIDVGPQGHINAESGHGPWPAGLSLYRELVAAQGDLPIGELRSRMLKPQRRRLGALAALRQGTRAMWTFPLG